MIDCKLLGQIAKFPIEANMGCLRAARLVCRARLFAGGGDGRANLLHRGEKSNKCDQCDYSYPKEKPFEETFENAQWRKII